MYSNPLNQEQSNHPRSLAEFQYAYPVVSRRSGGISIGVNLNIDKACNFDCPYCQVDRTIPREQVTISVNAIQVELEKLLSFFDGQGVFRMPRFSPLADKDKRLRDIAISGDGEPTMIPAFAEVCSMLARLQVSRVNLDFKLILITNSTLLDRKSVLEGIGHLMTKNGEVWAKLDAGTEEWYQKVNVSRVRLDQIESNLIGLGKSHPYKIQSLFCALSGVVPSREEVNAYLNRLQRIQAAGSDIQEVQLHTLARKPAQDSCTPVSEEFLNSVKIQIESQFGIPAKMYGVEA